MVREFETLLNRIGEGWAVIQQAPGAALMLIVAGGFIVWLWGRRRISILDERLKAKDDELARYKQKLDGATPEEVKAELESLRSALRSQEEQIKELESLRDALRNQDEQVQKLEKQLGEVRGMATLAWLG